MPKKLRSNFPYGSYLWAVRAAQWRALGIDESELEKPKIAIVNSSSNLAICFSHLDGIAAELKQAIRDAGALPFEIRTAAPSDFITGAGAGGAYMLAARDLITNDIEVAVEGAQLDGMICLASCDKTVPGQLMAAARLNIPTLVVVCGYQPSGEYNGRHVDIEDVFIGSMHALTGKLPVDELVGMARNAIKGPGVCSGMGTANSMHLVCEALGMALPGSSSADAIAALQDGRIRPGHVVVMRGAGVRGGPAMGGGASRVVFAIDGAGLGDKVAMLTDGHLSGLVCKGLVVAEVAPEAAVGGPLALLVDGDIIDIDLDHHRLDARIASAELQARARRWRPQPAQFGGGWLDIYRDAVKGMEHGAVLIKPLDISDEQEAGR